MLSTRRVSRTRRTRNTRTPSHPKTAARAKSPARSGSESETSTGHPVATRSAACREPSTMTRSGPTPPSTAPPPSVSEPTTPTPNSAATPNGKPLPGSKPDSKSAPAAQASRATSPRPVLTPMTSSGYASRTVATNGATEGTPGTSTMSAPSATAECTHSIATAGSEAMPVWPPSAAGPEPTPGATAMTSNCHGSKRRRPSRSTPAGRTPISGPPVHRNRRPGDQRRVVGDQERQHRRELGRFRPPVVHRVGQRRAVGRRVDDAGQDAVDPNPVLAPLDRGRLDQAHHAELAHAVGEGGLPLLQRDPARDVHDRAAAPRGQQRHRVLGDDRRADQVQLELSAEHADVEHGQTLRRGVPADQVDHRRGRRDPRERRRDAGLVQGVHDHVLHLVLPLPGGRDPRVERQHRRAVVPEPLGDRPPEPAGRAQHDNRAFCHVRLPWGWSRTDPASDHGSDLLSERTRASASANRFNQEQPICA